MSSTATPTNNSVEGSTTSTTSTTTATTTAAQATTPSTPTASAATSGGGGSGGTFSSVADLKAKAPEVYKAMMQSIAMNICNDSQNWNDRIKSAMKEGEDNNP